MAPMRIQAGNTLTVMLAFALATCALAFCCILSISSTANADTLRHSYSTKEKDISGKVVEKKGNSFYKLKSGKSVKSAFVTIGKKTYYFDKKHHMVKGWKRIHGSYYYFDRKTGIQKKARKHKTIKVDGIKIFSSGKALKTPYSKGKIELMIKARSIVRANTSYKDSKSLKRLKMFKWVMAGYYKQWRTLGSTGHKKGWDLTFAKDMFYHDRLGCCVSNACAFAYLAKECGYQNVEICDDTGHAFTRIDGKYFDTLFAEVHGMKSYYNATKSQARKDFAVNALKI